MSWIIDKYLKLGEKLSKTRVGKFCDKVLTDPEYGYGFLTGVLALGAFGFICCLVWFYLLIKSGMPWEWIVFDSAVVLFCIWVIFKMIIPLAKEDYKYIDKQWDEKYGKKDD